MSNKWIRLDKSSENGPRIFQAVSNQNSYLYGVPVSVACYIFAPSPSKVEQK